MGPASPNLQQVRRTERYRVQSTSVQVAPYRAQCTGQSTELQEESTTIPLLSSHIRTLKLFVVPDYPSQRKKKENENIRASVLVPSYHSRLFCLSLFTPFGTGRSELPFLPLHLQPFSGPPGLPASPPPPPLITPIRIQTRVIKARPSVVLV